MVGAQAIVAYPQSDGTVRAYTSPISSYQTSLLEAELSFNVSQLSATYQNNEMVIYAILNLPLANGGIINTVWQDGSLSGNNPLPHPTSGNNVRSVSTLNLVSGASGSTSTGAGGASKLRKRNVSPWFYQFLHFMFFRNLTYEMRFINPIIVSWFYETYHS